MIPNAVTIYLAVRSVDLRWGYQRLSGAVTMSLGGNPRSGDLFIFYNARRTHIKVLFHDGSGYCVLYKRLDAGTFRLPVVTDPLTQRVSISEPEFQRLLAGTIIVNKTNRTGTIH
jgi:transposase